MRRPVVTCLRLEMSPVMKQRFVLALAVCSTISIAAVAADHRVEVLDEAAPADQLSEEIVAQLAPTGLRVIRGENRTVCEIWLCKEWSVDAGFEPSRAVNYPFKTGQLIGVARYPRRGAGFRDQDIDKGVYTLRYAQQPVDGNHEGTSPTRDFLLLVRADVDRSPAPVEEATLHEQSSESIESTHPALLCMQKVQGDASSAPAMRHNESRDWWIVQFAGQAKVGDETMTLPVDLVVVGSSKCCGAGS